MLWTALPQPPDTLLFPPTRAHRQSKSVQHFCGNRNDPLFPNDKSALNASSAAFSPMIRSLRDNAATSRSRSALSGRSEPTQTPGKYNRPSQYYRTLS